MVTAILKNEATGEFKEVKIGMSFILFFFSSWFGIPLFIRKLTSWGVICFLIQVLILCFLFFGDYENNTAMAMVSLIQLATLGISGYLLLEGNKLTALNYIKMGFKIAETDPIKIDLIQRKWGISSNAFMSQTK